MIAYGVLVARGWGDSTLCKGELASDQGLRPTVSYKGSHDIARTGNLLETSVGFTQPDVQRSSLTVPSPLDGLLTSPWRVHKYSQLVVKKASLVVQKRVSPSATKV